MNIFFTLILAHLIADFPLQTNGIFALKLKSKKGIALHVFIHLIVTGFLIKEPFTHLPLFIILGVTHFLVDWLKLRFPTNRQAAGFLLDQVLHLIVLVFLSAISTTVQSALPDGLLFGALIYAFFPPIIMFLWLLAIDLGQVTKKSVRCVSWGQRRLLPISQLVGLPLILCVGVGIFL
jgi:hypothetical protein